MDGRFERMLRAAQARVDAVADIDTTQWLRTVRRRTPPASGGLTDKGTKGKRTRKVPIAEEISPFVAQRTLSAGPDPDARLFTGPRGGRISTTVLRDATRWDVRKISAVRAAFSARLSELRAPRSRPGPIIMTR